MILFTVELTKDGLVTSWTASTEEGEHIEDCTLQERADDATTSHTWDVSEEQFMVIRDILMFIMQKDWTEDQTES